MNPKIEENKMTPYLKRYRMKITAIGPIHVGDGKKLKNISMINKITEYLFWIPQKPILI